MICKNCGKYTSLDWIECPSCGFLHNSAEFQKLLEHYKLFLIARNYIKAKIILEKALKIARYSSKEEQILQQIDKLNTLIKTAAATNAINYTNAAISGLEKPSTNYVKTLVISKSEDEEARKYGKHKYNKGLDKNVLVLAILLFPALVYFLFFYQFSKQEEYYEPAIKYASENLTTQDSQIPYKIITLDERNDIEYKHKIENLNVKVIVGDIVINSAVLKNEITITNGSSQTIKVLPKSKAQINIEGIAAIIEENTELVIEEATGDRINGAATKIKLNKGAAFFDIKKITKNDKFEIITPILTAGVRGTKFLIDSTNETSAVHCLKGLLAVKDNISGTENELHGGFSCTVKAGAKPILQKLDDALTTKLKEYESVIFNLRLGIPLIEKTEEKKAAKISIKKSDPVAEKSNTLNLQNKTVTTETVVSKEQKKAAQTAENDLTEKVLNKYKTTAADTQIKAEKKDGNDSRDSNIVEFVKEKYIEELGSDAGQKQFDKDYKTVDRSALTKQKINAATDFQKSVISQTRDKFGDDKLQQEAASLKLPQKK